MADPRLVRIEDVAALDNLLAAFWRAALGKRHRAEVIAFAADLDRELARLGAEIRAGTVEVGRLRTFEIRDPKRRTIHAPAFRERVLHHALMAFVGPILDRALVPGTYACRQGKGTLAAVEAAERLAGRYPVFAKLDVRSYFASIDHEILRGLLRRRIAGARTLALLDRIVASHEAASGRGLPIGSLCSQHLANLYLAGLDRLLVERKIGLVRYMDDLVIFGRTRREVQAAAAAAITVARDRLRLDLGLVHGPAATARGVPLCGFRVRAGHLSLSLRRRRRYGSARRRAEALFKAGAIDGAALQRATTAALAITAHADAAAFRRRDLVRRPAPDV